jgi:hypothetical protein
MGGSHNRRAPRLRQTGCVFQFAAGAWPVCTVDVPLKWQLPVARPWTRFMLQPWLVPPMQSPCASPTAHLAW